LRILDISVLLQNPMPVWPGDEEFRLRRTKQLEAGDAVNASRLECNVHAGTHVDAPRHFLEKGCTVEQLPLEILIGPAQVAYLPEVNAIGAEDLATLALSPGTGRLLLRTRNSELWAAEIPDFRPDYVALTAEAAHWLVINGIRLIGIDYLSVQRFQDSRLTHQVLLEAGVIILEGLNLADVAPGVYELICLPLRLRGAEGAPARAVLRTLTAKE